MNTNNKAKKTMATALIVALAGVAMASTMTSSEFRLDCRTGLREARATEAIRYSTAWATNLTAEAQNAATAVVKVNPVLKTPPKYLVVDMSGGPDAVRWPVSSLDEVPEGGWSDEYKTGKLVLRHIPAGSFIMGERSTDFPGAVNTNLHMVVLTKDFYMGVFEVTQRQWELAMGTRPSIWSNDVCYAARPVSDVSYTDIRGSVMGLDWPLCQRVDDGSFLSIFAAKTNVGGFDLPTEAQWEYSCRAGTTTALNSGKNLSDKDNATEMSEVGRFGFNSGVADSGYRYESSVFDNCDSTLGSAKVGSYRPNGWGLYDMHGNLWEWCLDWRGDNPTGGVDPVGPEPGSHDNVVTRGGSLKNKAYEQTSSYRGAGLPTQKGWNVGFRLCLNLSDSFIPDDSSPLELVRSSDEGSADWTPTQSGTYLLTHEVQTNGVAVGAFETALFRVGGPALSIEPQGELTNGVEIAIGGADGWPVYYTTDGSDPTSMSDRYDGPFSLPSNVVVRAVAISEGGVSGDPARADFTLHDPFGLVGAVARPRYPWNGLVDVDFDLRGDPDLEYLVSLEALDMLGHTNLPVRTVTGETRLAPGRHRLTWNAAADIAAEGQFPQVAVTVKATGSVLNRFSRTLGLSVARYAGTEVLSGVPTLVRLSESIPGFRYADFASPADGADLAFFDADENELPYEIDEWNPNGESLVWVRLPVLTNGVPFLCAYGNPQPVTRNPQLSSHDVWRDYAGVWHMNEDAGTAFDSTEHHLDGIPDRGENGNVNQMVAYENAPCGRGRVNASEYVALGNSLQAPSYDALSLGGCFTFSGWFHADTVIRYPKFAFRNTEPFGDGWVFEMNDSQNTTINVRGSGEYADTRSHACPITDITEGFLNFTIIYDNDVLRIYTNGSVRLECALYPAKDNGLPLTIGKDGFVGQYDEIRLRGGTLSADRIKADYDMIADRRWLEYGKVENTVGTEVP